METFEAIITRRSIRRYKTDKIPQDILNNLLKAAMYAPSAQNQQPWHFIVLDDRNMLNEIAQKHPPEAAMCKNAAAGILISADLSLEQAKDMWILDCAAATQNILLASHAFNIGSVWIGVYFKKAIIQTFTDLLKLPKNIVPVSFVALGYPDQKIPKVDRFKKERIHFNSF